MFSADASEIIFETDNNHSHQAQIELVLEVCLAGSPGGDACEIILSPLTKHKYGNLMYIYIYICCFAAECALVMLQKLVQASSSQYSHMHLHLPPIVA